MMAPTGWPQRDGSLPNGCSEAQPHLTCVSPFGIQPQPTDGGLEPEIANGRVSRRLHRYGHKPRAGIGFRYPIAGKIIRGGITVSCPPLELGFFAESGSVLSSVLPV